jgi:hypothetical protein
MELRTIRIYAFGALGLVVAFSFSFLESYLLLTMAVTPLLLLIVGQCYLPRSNRSIQLWFNPLEIDGDPILHEPGEPLARLSGKVISYSYFKKTHDFEIVTHRFWLLGLVGFFSFGSIWYVFASWDVLFKGFLYFYAAGTIWMIVVLLATRWIWERRILRFEGLSLASHTVATNSKPPYRQIRYFFVDNKGDYRGAIFDSMVCDPRDTMTIIFYNESNPDQNVPAAGLMFHKLVWADNIDI